MSKIRELLAKAVSINASDVHLKPDQDPHYRAAGKIVESGFDKVTVEDMEGIVQDIMPSHLTVAYAKEHEADFSFVEEDVGRFRVNVFMAQHAPSVREPARPAFG